MSNVGEEIQRWILQFKRLSTETAVGLVVAGLTFTYSLAQNRGKRFYKRSVQLLDLHARFTALGPLAGHQ